MPFQSMREMLGVADEGAFALAYAQQSYADEIIERDRHNDQRHKNRIPLATLCFVIIGGAQSQQSNKKAHYERAGVAHKDFGGREIEYQESQQCSNEDQRKASDEDLAAYCGGGEKN